MTFNIDLENGEYCKGTHLLSNARKNLIFVLNKLLATRKHEASDHDQNEEG